MSITQNPHKFSLSKHFVDKYKDIEPPFGFNGLGKFTYERTYSRVKEDGNQEEWFETVERVVNGTYTMQKKHIQDQGLHWSENKAHESAQKMFDKIFQMKFTPPGRGLWAMGTKITEDKHLYAALNNCAFVSTINIATEYSKAFKFLMDMSMLGVGVGFDVKGADKITVNEPNPDGFNIESVFNYQYESKDKSISFIQNAIIDIKEKIKTENEKPKPNAYLITSYNADLQMYETELKYVQEVRAYQMVSIDDTREGWVDSVGMLIDSYLQQNRKPIIFDYSKIRAAGVLLKTFNGYSSGPIPLFDLHCMIRGVMNKNINALITLRTITDVMNMIAKAVVAGNVRRCLPKGTKIHIVDENGVFKFVPIETADKTMRAVLFDNGDVKYGKILSLTPTTQFITTINTEIGDIRTSMQHTFAVSKFQNNDMTGGPHGYAFIPAGFLTAGDEIMISIHDNLEYLDASQRDILLQVIKKKYPDLPREGNRIYKIPNGVYAIRVVKNVSSVPNLQDECYDIEVEGLQRFAIEQGFITHNSSEIALGPLNSEEFLNLKNYEVNPDRMSYGWCSNNSVIIESDNVDYSQIAERIIKNGEPGCLWINNCRNYSRMGHNPPDYKDIRAEGTNPCSEQTLEPYELCCLVETFLNRHSSIEEFLETLKYAYLYAKTVTLGRTHWVETNTVLMRNRRIGASITGIVQFLAKHSVADFKIWLQRGYDIIQKYDKVYSEWFTIPRSIKTTSVKPSGCLNPSTQIITSNGLQSLEEIFKDNGVELDHTVADKWIEPVKETVVVDKDNNLQKITKLYIKGKSPAYKIKFDDGTEVVCSAEHKFLINESNEKYFVSADQLVKNLTVAE